MNRKYLFALPLLLASVMSIPLSAAAADELNVSKGLVETGQPLAVHGYDVVSFFTQAKPTLGNSKFDETYQDVTYRFSSEENLMTFKSNPVKYAPQFGGYCAFGAALGKKFDGDPQSWTVTNGKLYLNLNPDIQEKFSKDVPGFIAKAEANWKKIQHSAVAGL